MYLIKQKEFWWIRLKISYLIQVEIFLSLTLLDLIAFREKVSKATEEGRMPELR